MSKKLLCLCFIFILLSASVICGQKTSAYLTEPSISPDRKEIAFVSGGDIWTVSAFGGTAQLLISHPATEGRPLYSPDGKRLAFVSNRTGNGDIYILHLETGNLQRITFDDSNDQLDAWSRDGNWLYFSSSSKDISGMNDIFRVSAAGGTPMQISFDRYTTEFQTAPAPDGSIAFSARGNSLGQWWRRGRSHLDESEIWLQKGNAYEKIVSGGAKQNWTMWSSDGTKIYYVSDRSGTNNIWTQPIHGQAKQLTNFTTGRVLFPNISYDGKQIVVERDFRLWSLNTDNGKPTEIPVTLRGVSTFPLTERVNLLGNIDELALSPDGKKVALIGRGEVFAASAKTSGEALRITKTAAPESFVTWSGDSKTLFYASERNGTMQLFQYDFAAENESQITSAGNDYSPVVSPDGKNLAFIRNGRSLMLYDLSAKKERELAKFYTDSPPLIGKRTIAWSPDNKWLAFLTYSPETRSYTNVSLVSTDGATIRPVSFLANSNSGTLSWSPDGSFILFDTSQRTEDGFLARIDLALRLPKFREDQFRDLFKQENPKDKPTPNPVAAPAADDQEDKKPNEIVFENIRQRLSIMRPGISIRSQIISPDGKTLLVSASAEGQFNFYSISLDELSNERSAKQITSTSGFKSDAQFSPDSKEVYFLENGRVNIVSLDRREVRPLPLSFDLNVNFAAEKMEVFKQGWRYMRDNFYDDKFHGANWDTVYQTYEPLIQAARNMDEVRRLMNLMVGELNASHLGVYGNSGFAATPIGKLGLRFDTTEYETNGCLKITEIIDLSPAAISGAINVGDYLLSIEGTNIDKTVNLDELLENKVGKRIVLGISRDGVNKKDVAVKPISTGAEKNLLYRQWVESNRRYVEKISGGKLGYVHLPDMGQGTLNQLYIDLDAQNQAKEGVVIDIRNNNGGFINPYVIDILSRRGYLRMTERGLWTVPSRSALGQRSLERPTILVTNQHSLSDAEDFTEGYRSLKLGKVVGEPTSGWIIFTWNVQLFDGTTFRLPRQRIDGTDGKNMELNPRPVDISVTRPIGETLTGKDSQLDAAIKQLLSEIK